MNQESLDSRSILLAKEKEKEKEKENKEGNKTSETTRNKLIAAHARHYLFGAFVVAIIFIFFSGFLFDESDNIKRHHLWRAVATSLAWNFNGIGGTILTALVFAFILPDKLQTCIKDLQSVTYA